jgi:hypothetical protein
VLGIFKNEWCASHGFTSFQTILDWIGKSIIHRWVFSSMLDANNKSSM